MSEDRQLVRALKRGDDTAWRQIYIKYKDDLLTVARSLVCDVETAEDCLQDVFVLLASDRCRVRSNLKGYLLSCVVNRARVHLRKRYAQSNCQVNMQSREHARRFGMGSSLYERITESMNSWEADGKYTVTRELGTYQGRKVEIWTARRIKGEPKLTRTEKGMFYIDVEKKLPLMATDVKGAYGDVQTTNIVEFKYPETGPTDIYEAGAPRSAQIKLAQEQ